MEPQIPVLKSNNDLFQAQKKAIIRRMGQCKGSGRLPILFHTVAIARDTKTGDMTLSCKVTVRREVSEKFAIVVNIWRCDSTGNPDSCEIIVKNHNASNICELLPVKDQLWTIFLDRFDMSRKCPIKPGVYTLNKLPITTEFMKFMPMSDALWRTQLTGWDAGRYLCCVDLDLQIVPSYGNKNRRF
ncbi:hypothetical protein Trydic_g23697 [Trypoxylus dichotomus]